ncbi:glycoside hydrolase family 43 protein [Zasmidium cellare ATCC 36951]|uniref:Glycoside hydrolase family 43 protein n=1 Tax=Zasmidium cellare ATCC 36951 TaxID=1080233 RepID=A0A6A6CTA1_ZASCE|nr:glycoside hydrolase family 43 protein [Zasmidium cellare ATCC 36951]KAF2169408.1 glycoside hydrolase family 43 protein [Zasmidium cellare ATCC 36951]
MHSLTHSFLPVALLTAASSAINLNVLNGQDFADPGLLEVNGISYSYSTASNRGAIPKTSNSSFNNAGGWAAPENSFPQDSPAQSPGGWAKAGTSWAPDVVQLTDYDSSFAMYYASEINGNGGQPHCLGLARNRDNPNGPFTDGSTQSFICPASEGGAIDPEAFLDDDNSRYLAYKIDGPFNGQGPCGGTQGNTPIMLQPLQHDGYTFNGDARQVWDAQSAGVLGIEAPALLKRDGVYFLFYSVGCYAGNDYRTDYVTASNIYGPYSNPRTLLQTGDFGLFGPGGLDVVPGSLHATFHSLIQSGNVSAGRQLNTVVLSVNGNTATIS